MYRSNKRTFCTGLVLSSFLLGTAFSTRGADPGKETASWASLTRLAPGEKVTVVLNGAQSYQGQFKTLTAETIEIQTPSVDRTFQRQSVLRVSTHGVGHRGHHALMGALIGAGAGLAIGAAADRSPKCGASGPFFCGKLLPNLGKEIGAPLGAMTGGVVGALLPADGWHEVYRRP